MARKISKSRKRRLLVIGTASIVAFIFFCVNVFSYSYKIILLTKEQNRLVVELDKLKSEKERLDNEIKKLQDEDYIANYARENYSYSKENEIVIKTRDAYQDKISESENEIKNNKEDLKKLKIVVALISVMGLIFLVFIARIKKS